MNTAANLHKAIEAVCPIDGISIGDVNNKTTWDIQFKTSATAQQRINAQTILDTFIWDESPLDQSNLDNIEKRDKAILLCIAQVGGLSIAQIKAMFKAKFDSLP
jgi:hypothetical protein